MRAHEKASMTFGGYLVESGAITRRQLLAALTEQRMRELPIGKLALREHLMSEKDVLEILDAQLAEPQRLTGQLAVDAGLITDEDVVRLLHIQRESRERVGEILVELGALTDDELEHALRDYTLRHLDGAA